jgi:hypothetical protein
MDTVSQNTLKAIRFERPEYIPVIFWINPACWHHYEPQVLFSLMGEHRILFPEFDPENETVPEIAPWERAGVPYTDAWGCVWETTDEGITGTVTKHPLADWKTLESFTPPQRLSYLRGYENLLLDMTDREARLLRLIEMVETFNAGIVERYIEAGSAMICYPEDLGMQRGPMLSPEHFRTYIKPIYERIMAPAHKAGCLVHMHSDGDIRDLVDDLVFSGVDALNLQDLVNGIDWIEEKLKGRVCIDIDIDRQQITRFGSPEQIDKLIREEVEKLSSREGGLMMIYGLYPGVPRDNVKAVMDAMERYASYYS